MPKVKAPTLPKDKYTGTGLQRSGNLDTGGAQTVFAPFIKTKFRKLGKGKKLF